MLIVAMLFMSVASFSQITISQEDYDRLPGETRTQIEKITTEKAIKGEIKEVSEYASYSLGRSRKEQTSWYR